MGDKDNRTTAPQTPEPIPLYLESPDYAREHRELEQYRASTRENRRCIRAIADLIRDSYDGWRLNIPEEKVREIAGDYGKDRMTFLIANSIHCASYDSRYSRQNREWAEAKFDFSSISNEYEQYCLSAANAHPGLIDMFATKWRAIEARDAQRLLLNAEHIEKEPLNAEMVKKSAGAIRPKR